ncbi:MAG TPA: hypothetical protein VES89_12810 [Candidatus Competibacteraceae bacterium]|nr:hypothetical protein [Candidatus Competibacteraceae bacterium]
MITKHDFKRVFSDLHASPRSLPGHIAETLAEIREESAYWGETSDYTDLAEWVDVLLQEEGLPPVFFDGHGDRL